MTATDRERVPASGLLLAALATLLILDVLMLLVVAMSGNWIYAASLVLVAILTVVATRVLKANR